MLPEAQALEGIVTPLRGTDIRISGNSTLYQKLCLPYLVPEKTLAARQPILPDVFSPPWAGAVVALLIPF